MACSPMARVPIELAEQARKACNLPEGATLSLIVRTAISRFLEVEVPEMRAGRPTGYSPKRKRRTNTTSQ